MGTFRFSRKRLKLKNANFCEDPNGQDDHPRG